MPQRWWNKVALQSLGPQMLNRENQGLGALQYGFCPSSFPPHPVENKARPNTKNKKGQTQNLSSALTEMEKVTPSTVRLTRTLP